MNFWPTDLELHKGEPRAPTGRFPAAPFARSLTTIVRSGTWAICLLKSLPQECRPSQFCTNPPVLRVAYLRHLGDHWAMDIEKAAWITIQRALERVPLPRRRKVLRMLDLAMGVKSVRRSHPHNSEPELEESDPIVTRE